MVLQTTSRRGRNSSIAVAVKLRKNQKSPNILHLQKFRYIPVCTGGKVILLYGTVPLNHLKLILA